MAGSHLCQVGKDGCPCGFTSILIKDDRKPTKETIAGLQDTFDQGGFYYDNFCHENKVDEG